MGRYLAEGIDRHLAEGIGRHLMKKIGWAVQIVVRYLMEEIALGYIDLAGF